MFRLARLTKKFLCFSLVLSLPIFLPSCSGGRIDPLDLDTGTTREEAFDTILKNRDNEKKSNKASENKSPKETPIPKLSKLIVSPPPPVVGGDKVISFSVTDQVPLKDVLIEFGRMVKIDVEDTDCMKLSHNRIKDRDRKSYNHLSMYSKPLFYIN